MRNLEYSAQHVTIDAAIAAIKAMIAEFIANASRGTEDSYDFQDGGSFEYPRVFSNAPERYDLKITKLYSQPLHPLHPTDCDKTDPLKISDRTEYYLFFQQHNGYITDVKVICACPEKTLDHEFTGVWGGETTIAVDEFEWTSEFIEEILHETIWFM